VAGERAETHRSNATPAILTEQIAHDPFAFFSLDPGALGVGPN
jgi:hypothetical protein